LALTPAAAVAIGSRAPGGRMSRSSRPDYFDSSFTVSA
jgi:hypothetical protein